MPTPGLTCVGYGWSLLSLLAAGCVSVGYYIPLWLIGSLTLKDNQIDAYFGCFRRCNYPWSHPATHRIELVELCGRYKTFGDIPSLWWKICTVTVGVECAAALLVAFISVPACCIADIVSRTSARVLGIVQALSAILVTGGCIIYPLGWKNREVKDACGESAGPFLLGNCSIGWAYYLVLGGSALLFVCASLSTGAGRPIKWQKLTNSTMTYEHSALKSVNV